MEVEEYLNFAFGRGPEISTVGVLQAGGSSSVLGTASLSLGLGYTGTIPY